MTVTRHPTGQDLMCLVCLKPAQDIDHVVNRGMGGSKERDVPENKVPLCRECHDLKTVGTIETEVHKDFAGELFYQWRRNTEDAPWIANYVEVSERYKCLVLSAAAEGEQSTESVIGPSAAASSAPVLSDGAEAGNAPPQGADEAPTSTPSAPSLSTKEETTLGGYRKRVAQVSPSPPLTHEQRVAIAQEKESLVLTAAYNETSLVLKDGLSYEEWESEGHVLSQMTRCLAWWWGDWMNYGESHYGETYAQAINLTGKDYSTVSHWKWTADKVELCHRRQNLSWTHHYTVASLEPAQQDKWLLLAEEEKWSKRDLHAKLLESGLIEGRLNTDPKVPKMYRCPDCGFVAEPKAFALGKEITDGHTGS